MGRVGNSIGFSMNSDIRPFHILVKALCLFVIINFVYTLLDPPVSKLSAYNVLFPGLTRLPFGADSFSVMVETVDTMFASHLISSLKRQDEYRIVLIGDSSVWGEDLGAYEVMSEQWNRLNVRCGEKTIRAYDLGYPHPSVVKDLVILEKAVEYEPDLIIWFVTLNTLNPRQVNPFLEANHERVVDLLNTYDIPFSRKGKLNEDKEDFFAKTLIGQRSNLARQIKLQLLGIIWTATSADTNRLAEEEPEDFNVGYSQLYRGMDSSVDITNLLLFSTIEAGIDIANPAPVLIVNEPIFIAKEEQATVRYNAMYPRWAYDQFRAATSEQAQIRGWNYLDLWNAIPPEYFSDAGVHRSVASERLLIQEINPVLQSIACDLKP